MDTSRLYWQRLLLIENEKFTTAGIGTSLGGKKSAAAKWASADGRADQIRRTWDKWRAKGYLKGEADQAVAEALKISTKTVRTARK
jgi:hypothetical protein